MACAAAERGFALYERLGPGDPAVLRSVIDGMRRWAETGAEPDATTTTAARKLDRWASRHYDEGDDLLASVVSSALVPFEIFEARDVPEERALAAARAFTRNVDLSEEVEAILGGTGRVDEEERLWRGDTYARLLAASQPVQGLFPAGRPGWTQDAIAAM
jgi:hypothetical protein